MEINEVFTLRKDLNNKMYVERPELEKSLSLSIDKGLTVILCGESGNGKSWLYTKVFKSKKITFDVVTFPNNIDSIKKGILNSILQHHEYQKKSFSEKKFAAIKKFFLSVSTESTDFYEKTPTDELLESFKLIKKKYKYRNIFRKIINLLTLKKDKYFIVLDNLENIFHNKELIRELADIIILKENPPYNKYSINLLIVGTQIGLYKYFGELENIGQSISTRVTESKKVGKLTKDQVEKIIKTGFVELLKYRVEDNDLSDVCNHIYKITLGIAYYVQDYCYTLAEQIQLNNGEYHSSLLDNSDKEWLRKSLHSQYSLVRRNLNANDVKEGRKDQTIYCLSKIETSQFSHSDIEVLIRQEFPVSDDKTIRVYNILSNLSGGDNPLLIKYEKEKTYSIKDPKSLMCIRAMLQKDRNGKIKTTDIDQIIE